MGYSLTARLSEKYCSDLGIKNRYSTLAYRQSNGQAKATNKAIVTGLNKRLEGAKGRWANELPNVLWAYHTMPRMFIGVTPFSMTYEAEAMIPMKIGLYSIVVLDFTLKNNDTILAKPLDLLEVRREMALIRLANYKQKLAQRYDQGVIPREFFAGDLVLRKVVGSMKDLSLEGWL
ncbi:uncharacterized protein LOC142635802 [Castanea sativa]|uniref:uncharacterized protein LOC142635802 n=1 Tax=Castanea sativa TaxID=21020 RepID=UPI003F64CFD1